MSSSQMPFGLMTFVANLLPVSQDVNYMFSSGANVEIRGAYLWDGCRVGDNCVITTSILDTDVQIKEGVTIKSGCVIAKNVSIL